MNLKETNSHASTTPSPSPSEEDDESATGSNAKVNGDEKKTETLGEKALPPVRSSSTLPFPQPSSCPPTPTGLAGTSSSFEYEDIGDLILFYNTVYVRRLQAFAIKFSNKNRLVLHNH